MTNTDKLAQYHMDRARLIANSCDHPAYDNLAQELLTLADSLAADNARLQAKVEAHWQPIETAPKDGTRILFYDPMSSGLIMSGWWDKMFELHYDQAKDETIEIGAWTDGCVLSFGYEETCSYEPTHWKPLPPPPA